MPGAELVGRDDVLALAGRRWAEASEGRGQTILVAGEAGIGKSRILAEIRALVGDAILVSAAAWPRDADAPGALLLDLAAGLRRAGFREAGDGVSARLGPEGVAAVRRLVPEVAELLLEVAGAAPSLIALDDVHWADELSLEVLQRVASGMRDTPSLLVVGYRSDELFAGTAAAGWRARLLQTRAAEEVRLPRLDAEGTTRLAAALTGSVPAGAWAARLHERSDGIPLHVEELVAAGSSDGVPETVAQAVIQRAAELSPAAMAVVEAAAVVGRAADAELLAAVSGEGDDALDVALAELRDRHFLVATRATTPLFDVRHALIRDAIAERIPPGRLRALHARTARAGAAAGLTDAELSDHFERAGLTAEAHERAVAAADAAMRASAHREAAALLARALRTMPSDAPPVEAARLHSRLGIVLALLDDNAAAAAELEPAMAQLLELGLVDEAVDHVPRIMGVRHVLGEPLEQRVARAREGLRLLDERAGGGTAKVRGGVHAALAAAYMLDRRLEEAIAEAEQGLAIADDADDIVNLQATLGPVLVFAGRGDEGWTMLEEAIAAGLAGGYDLEIPTARAFRMIGSSASAVVAYDRAEAWIAQGLAMTRATETWNDHHYLRAHRAHVRWATGDPGAAEDAAQAIADGGSQTTEITARHVLGFAALGRDDLATAREHLGRARGLGARMQELQRLSPALWGLAETALAGGNAAEAVEFTAEAAARSAEVEDAAYLFPHLVTGVRARLIAGTAAEANAWLAEVGPPVARRGIPGTLPALDHAAGLIALAEGRIADARALLETALDGWITWRRYWEQTWALLDLARVARRARRPAEEEHLLEAVRERAASADAPLFARLATQQAASAHGSSEAAGPLTAREFEVARLIASGATNREIAERLVIAPKTVSAHVEHILAKLHVARRAEVAAWVARE